MGLSSTGLILDTSVVIAAERRGHSVLEMLQQLRATHGKIDIGLSVVTVAELMHGVFRSRSESQKQGRLRFINRLTIDLPVYSLNLAMARTLGRIEGEQGAKGVKIAFQDLAIGVTELHLDFEGATLNVRHFQLIPGLRIA